MKQRALSRSSIIKKTVQVGGSTLMSRFVGIIREMLLVKFLGVGAVADAFITAWKLPNSLRKVFAEGALSSAFVPSLVRLVKEKKQDDANGLMSLVFIVFEGALLLLCGLIILKARTVVWLMAPGFSPEQIEQTAPFLQILIPFILFISSSALLAGAMNAVHHFFVPAFSPVLLNVSFIVSLALCLSYNLSVTTFCIFILVSACLQLLVHLVTFWRLEFTFGAITPHVKDIFLVLLAKFGNCLLSMSVIEIQLLIDTMFASLLPTGSVALLYYANRFMGIPLGVFVTAFSTILLPHFSHVMTYAPRRLDFYLLEASKFMFWITFPVCLYMIFFSYDIFYTLFFSQTFTIEKVSQAALALSACVSGLFFYALNRIFLNLYYAMHNTIIPLIASVIATLTNIGLNFLFVYRFHIVGLVVATVLSSVIQIICYVWCLRYYRLRFYVGPFMDFLTRYCVQLVFIGSMFLALYKTCYMTIEYGAPGHVAHLLLHSVGLWVWVIPLCVLSFVALYATRRFFGIRVYFLG